MVCYNLNVAAHEAAWIEIVRGLLAMMYCNVAVHVDGVDWVHAAIIVSIAVTISTLEHTPRSFAFMVKCLLIRRGGKLPPLRCNINVVLLAPCPPNSVTPDRTGDRPYMDIR